jgi:uncharacterized membrane protein YvbJ
LDSSRKTLISTLIIAVAIIIIILLIYLIATISKKIPYANLLAKNVIHTDKQGIKILISLT